MVPLALVLFARDTGSGYGRAGLLTAAYSLGCCLGGPALSRVMDLRGQRAALVLGGVVSSLALAVLPVGAVGWRARRGPRRRAGDATARARAAHPLAVGAVAAPGAVGVRARRGGAGADLRPGPAGGAARPARWQRRRARRGGRGRAARHRVVRGVAGIAVRGCHRCTRTGTGWGRCGRAGSCVLYAAVVLVGLTDRRAGRGAGGLCRVGRRPRAGAVAGGRQRARRARSAAWPTARARRTATRGVTCCSGWASIAADVCRAGRGCRRTPS